MLFTSPLDPEGHSCLKTGAGTPVGRPHGVQGGVGRNLPIHKSGRDFPGKVKHGDLKQNVYWEMISGWWPFVERNKIQKAELN